MQRKTLLWGGGLLLLTAVAAAVWMGGGSESPGKTKEKSGAPVSHERPRPQTHEGAAKKEPGTEKVPEDAAVVAKRAEEKKATLEAINDAATTYEAAQLPFINKYLYDRDPEVRKAAMEAMLVLGDAGAGKYLREAAQSAATEAERDALVKAADYSELPPVDMKTMAEQRKLQKQNNPSGNERRPRRDRGVGQKRLENGAPPATGQPTGDAPVPNPAPTPVPGQ